MGSRRRRNLFKPLPHQSLPDRASCEVLCGFTKLVHYRNYGPFVNLARALLVPQSRVFPSFAALSVSQRLNARVPPISIK